MLSVMFENWVLIIIYYRYDFNVASIMITNTTYSLKRDLKFRSWNVCLYVCARKVQMKIVLTTLK
jgi:hypothetical protein